METDGDGGVEELYLYGEAGALAGVALGQDLDVAATEGSGDESHLLANLYLVEGGEDLEIQALVGAGLHEDVHLVGRDGDAATLTVVEELQSLFGDVPGLAQRGCQLVLVSTDEDVAMEGCTYLVAVLTSGMRVGSRRHAVRTLALQELVGYEETERRQVLLPALAVLGLQPELRDLGIAAGEEKPNVFSIYGIQVDFRFTVFSIFDFWEGLCIPSPQRMGLCIRSNDLDSNGLGKFDELFHPTEIRK